MDGAMSKDSPAKSGPPPQIFRLDKALKLAEQWVNNMTKSVEEEAKESEPSGRPSKLGLGAKNVRQSTVSPFNGPVERKLQAKLEASKRKAAKLADSSPKADGGNDHGSDDDSDRELESRTTIFAKKRVGVAAPLPPSKKKHK